jgi:hypothetical protein
MGHPEQVTLHQVVIQDARPRPVPEEAHSDGQAVVVRPSQSLAGTTDP